MTRLTLKELVDKTGSAPVDIIVASYEGSLYQAFVQSGEDEHLIWHDNDKPLKTHNLQEMRERLHGLNIGQLFLRQDSAYDEMIGQDTRVEPNTLKLKLDNHQDDDDMLQQRSG